MTQRKYKEFSFTKSIHIKEIQVTLFQIEHIPTKAEIIHIAANDEENVFALCFKTYPSNETGVAHILEHAVLCGSKKYPIHDAFFAMHRRSINTFMNAFTAKLWTCYPAASKNKKDFYNLLDVYLDCVFHPLLKKESFQQEGYRFTLTDPNNINSPLALQGVVFNEMKGVYSNPDSLLWRKTTKGLFPKTCYGNDSGGDPQEIPTLTYEDFISFHQTFYHPSRTIFYFYGNFPIEEHLDFIHQKILSSSIYKPKIPPVKKEPKFSLPRRESSFYPSNSPQDQLALVSFSWITMDIKEADLASALMVLDSIFMDTDASWLKWRLLQSKFCIDVESAIDFSAREVPYMLFFRGCERKNIPFLEKYLFDSLKEFISKKLPKTLIESALHQMEFSRTEIHSGGQPYGLELFERSVLPYLQGMPIAHGLKIQSIFHKLRKLIFEEKIFSHIIKNFFLNNPHHHQLTLLPNQNLPAILEKEEQKFLQEKQNTLSMHDKEKLLQEENALQISQQAQKEENIDILPMLTIKDIPSESTFFPLMKEIYNQLNIYHHECFTNGIVYVDLVFPLTQMHEEDLLYLRLFAAILPDLGAGNSSYTQTLQQVHYSTGGIWTSLSLHIQKNNHNICSPTLSISGKSLQRNTKFLFDLIKNFALSPNIQEEDRIRDILIQSHTHLEQSLNVQAFYYALKESASNFSPWNYINHLWHGAPYHKFLSHIVYNIKTSLPTVIHKLTDLQQKIFLSNTPCCVLSCDRHAYQEIKEQRFFQWDQMITTSNSVSPWLEYSHPSTSNIIYTLSYSIAHNAQSFFTTTLSSPDAPKLKLASYLLNLLEIHQRVREKGGAYVCGVKYNIISGIFQFFSSRDPHIAHTYAHFREAIHALSQGKFSQQNLIEAKLRYIQEADAPIPPGRRAAATYAQEKIGLTKEEVNRFRYNVLHSTKDDVINAIKTYLVPNYTHAIQTTYANMNIIEREQALLKEMKLPPMTVIPFEEA